MKKLNVGLYGFGDVASEYTRSFLNNPHSTVKAIVGHSPERTKKRVASFGWDIEILNSYDELVKRNDIDVIVLTTPHFLHADEAIQAAQAGKHVVCEKPIGMNVEEVKAVHKAIKESNVKFQSGMVLRWNPYIETLKHMLDNDVFGKVYYIEVDYFHKLGPEWNGFTWGGQKFSGGPSASLVAGIHAVDLMRYLCGEVEHLFANGTHGHRLDFEYKPTYSATVKFANGAVGKTSCSFENESPYLLNVMIHGSKGSVVNDKFYFKESFPGQTGWQKFETIMPDSGAVTHHPFQGLIDDFVDAILNDGSTLVNIDETFKTHEVCMAIDHSIMSEEKVILPYF